MDNCKIVMYRVRERQIGEDTMCNPIDNFKIHAEHAMKNSGRLLFTTDCVAREKVSKLVFALSETDQLIGDVVKYGKYGNNQAKSPYWETEESISNLFTVPLEWESWHKNYEMSHNFGWYAVENIKLLDDELRTSLKNSEGKTFIDVFNDKKTYHNVIYFEE
ncbi:hypothetical protein [Streptococcus sp.]